MDAHSEWVHSICGIGENHGSHCLAVETDSMRDIRHDLRERLASISGRYADEMAQYQEKREALDNAHRDTMTALDREKVAVEQLLAVEEERQGILPAAVEARKTARLVALDNFLVTKVHAHGPMDKDQLRAEANLAGYFAEGNGRTFHVTLMNVKKCGRLVQLPDGRYAFPERHAATLFGGGDQATEGEMLTVMLPSHRTHRRDVCPAPTLSGAVNGGETP